jgi:hypothetical protein
LDWLQQNFTTFAFFEDFQMHDASIVISRNGKGFTAHRRCYGIGDTEQAAVDDLFRKERVAAALSLIESPDSPGDMPTPHINRLCELASVQ